VSEAGVIQVWSDLLCPFAYLAVHQLHAARAGRPPDDPASRVRFEHHAFALELFDGAHRRRATDAEVAGLGGIAPSAGLRIWAAPDDLYPSTVLLAVEAVLAAEAQSHTAGELLDLALRTAFWTDSRSIAHRQVILDVADEVMRRQPNGGLNVASLAAALDDGRHRANLTRDHAFARTGAIAGSPTFVLADGYTVTNPGITVHWEGPELARVPIVDHYESGVYDELLDRAAVPHQRLTKQWPPRSVWLR
jgi:predicted DsbA family dithiol-disulfide isomerase